MKPFGPFTVTPGTKRNGKINKELYLTYVEQILERKKKVDKEKKTSSAMVFIHDDAPTHRIPDSTLTRWRKEYNVRFLKFGGGATSTIQMDMASPFLLISKSSRPSSMI